MTRQQLVRPLLLFAAIATLGQAPRALAIEYLSVEFSQHVSATVRDYIGDPGFTTVDNNRTIELPIHWPFDAQRSLGVVTDVTRTGNHGLTATAHSKSIASYQISSLTSGFASFEHSVSTQTYQTDDSSGEAFGSAGAGDITRIRFRIDESDGDVTFQSRSASIYNTPKYPQSYPLGNGAGSIYIEQNGVPVGGGPLGPGEWTILLRRNGVGVSNASSSLTASGSFGASWTFDGSFVGDTPGNPYVPIVDTEDSEGEPSDPPVSTSGPILSFPVPADDGPTETVVFFGLPTLAIRGDSAGALVTGYEITSEYSRLTSFVVPELPPGAEGLTIDTGAGPQSIVAGETIDFGPEGLASFTLAGFDPLHASAELDAVVMGLHFAEAGLASLIAIPILYIPPGDYNENGLVDAADYTIWRDTLGASVELGSGADGNSDGAVTQADYLVWKNAFGSVPASNEIANAVAVPEPTSFVLGLIALGTCCWLKARRRR